MGFSVFPPWRRCPRVILYRTIFFCHLTSGLTGFIYPTISFQGEERKIHCFWYRLSFLRIFFFLLTVLSIQLEHCFLMVLERSLKSLKWWCEKKNVPSESARQWVTSVQSREWLCFLERINSLWCSPLETYVFPQLLWVEGLHISFLQRRFLLRSQCNSCSSLWFIFLRFSGGAT